MFQSLKLQLYHFVKWSSDSTTLAFGGHKCPRVSTRVHDWTRVFTFLSRCKRFARAQFPKLGVQQTVSIAFDLLWIRISFVSWEAAVLMVRVHSSTVYRYISFTVMNKPPEFPLKNHKIYVIVVKIMYMYFHSILRDIVPADCIAHWELAISLLYHLAIEKKTKNGENRKNIN